MKQQTSIKKGWSSLPLKASFWHSNQFRPPLSNFLVDIGVKSSCVLGGGLVKRKDVDNSFPTHKKWHNQSLP